MVRSQEEIDDRIKAGEAARDRVLESMQKLESRLKNITNILQSKNLELGLINTKDNTLQREGTNALESVESSSCSSTSEESSEEDYDNDNNDKKEIEDGTQNSQQESSTDDDSDSENNDSPQDCNPEEDNCVRDNSFSSDDTENSSDSNNEDKVNENENQENENSPDSTQDHSTDENDQVSDESSVEKVCFPYGYPMVESDAEEHSDESDELDPTSDVDDHYGTDSLRPIELGRNKGLEITQSLKRKRGLLEDPSDVAAIIPMKAMIQINNRAFNREYIIERSKHEPGSIFLKNKIMELNQFDCIKAQKINTLVNVMLEEKELFFSNQYAIQVLITCLEYVWLNFNRLTAKYTSLMDEIGKRVFYLSRDPHANLIILGIIKNFSFVRKFTNEERSNGFLFNKVKQTFFNHVFAVPDRSPNVKNSGIRSLANHEIGIKIIIQVLRKGSYNIKQKMNSELRKLNLLHMIHNRLNVEDRWPRKNVWINRL